ncbi:hypothetical protein [Streptomyces sp. NBC_00316]|uniref:hypothetical protein n=1 Tax=Streptomyces sp. NBC_00316 TaxID=2975710 RepID=UPI002E29CDCF|nr:hypothetical protein [Streptomyces sp. NBC_00316]
MAACQSAMWAVGGFSEVLATEIGPLDINVTVPEPGGMRTDWAGASMHTPPVSEPHQATVGAGCAYRQVSRVGFTKGTSADLRIHET